VAPYWNQYVKGLPSPLTRALSVAVEDLTFVA
jgi:hypothetical protein